MMMEEVFRRLSFCNGDDDVALGRSHFESVGENWI